jgi:hypothetical protein
MSLGVVGDMVRSRVGFLASFHVDLRRPHSLDRTLVKVELRQDLALASLRFGKKHLPLVVSHRDSLPVECLDRAVDGVLPLTLVSVRESPDVEVFAGTIAERETGAVLVRVFVDEFFKNS